jgi:hypothetical protein
MRKRRRPQGRSVYAEFQTPVCFINQGLGSRNFFFFFF